MNIIKAFILFAGLGFGIGKNSYAQLNLDRLNSRDLLPLADSFGIDSALKRIPFFDGLELIDSSAVIELSKKCKELRSMYQLNFIITEGQLLKNDIFNRIVINKILENKFLSVIEIPDEFIRVLAFQNDASYIHDLRTEYDFWKFKSDSVAEKCAVEKSKTAKEKCSYFKNEYLINRYKIAWALMKLGDPDFTGKIVLSIKGQIKPNTIDLEQHYEPRKINFVDTIALSSSYNIIDDIDIAKEEKIIEFSRAKEKFSKSEFYKLLKTGVILNGIDAIIICTNRADYSMGGTIFRLTLISPNKLQRTLIKSWIL